MIKRLLLSIVMLLTLSGLCFAQSQSYKIGNVTDDATACTSLSCLDLTIPSNGAVAVVQILGTFVGTIQFEISPDGVNYISASGLPQPTGGGATSATSTGVWRFQVAGHTHIRVRASAWTSGIANIRINASLGFATL